MAANRIGKETADNIVAIRNTWHCKNHPFYLDFWENRLGLAALGTQMTQHYQHVHTTLHSFGVAYYKAPPEGRRFILQNLAEEEGLLAGPGEDRAALDHNDLILRFCRSVGLSDETVKATEQLPAWRARSYFYLNTVREEPFPVIVAMMATQEGQQPQINLERVLPALDKFHGRKIDDPSIEFFREHAVADVDHSGRLLDLVARYISNEDLAKRALEIAELAVKTRWAGFNDLYRAVNGQKDPLPKGIAA